MKNLKKPGTMAQACNPSYSGGSDQEDRGSKSRQIARKTLSLKNLHQKELVVWLKV
jgi:hypothetical protein